MFSLHCSFLLCPSLRLAFRCQVLSYFPAVLAVLLLLLLLLLPLLLLCYCLSRTLLPPSFSACAWRLLALSLRATLFITNGGVGAWPGSPHRFDVLRATVQSILTARRRHWLTAASAVCRRRRRRRRRWRRRLPFAWPAWLAGRETEPEHVRERAHLLRGGHLAGSASAQLSRTDSLVVVVIACVKIAF